MDEEYKPPRSFKFPTTLPRTRSRFAQKQIVSGAALSPEILTSPSGVYFPPEESKLPEEIFRKIAGMTSPEAAKSMSILNKNVKFNETMENIKSYTSSFLEAFNHKDITEINELIRERSDAISIIEQIQNSFEYVDKIYLLMQKGMRLSVHNFRRVIDELFFSQIGNILRYIPDEDWEFYLSELSYTDADIADNAWKLAHFFIDSHKNIRIHYLLCDFLINIAEKFISDEFFEQFVVNGIFIVLQIELRYFIGLDVQDLDIIYNTLFKIYSFTLTNAPFPRDLIDHWNHQILTHPYSKEIMKALSERGWKF